MPTRRPSASWPATSKRPWAGRSTSSARSGTASCSCCNAAGLPRSVDLTDDRAYLKKEMYRMEQSRPIVPPPGFPVKWEHPEDERLFWTHDRMHWPDPLPVVSFDLMIEDGVNPAAIEYDAPIRFDGRRINC